MTVKTGDYIIIYVDCGNAESGPREPEPCGVLVEDTDGVHVLYESPIDGEPHLCEVTTCEVISDAAVMEIDEEATNGR